RHESANMNATKFLPTLCRVLICALSLAAGAVSAEPNLPFLHPLFSDHMVLQRHAKVPVWGWAAPGAKVTVKFAGQTKVATAGPDGKWMVHLNSMPASSEARAMVVTLGENERSVTVDDVLVGDVWLCSGQSNMEMGIGLCNASGDIASANYPQIRLLTVPHMIAAEPVNTADVRWSPCSPVSVMQGTWGGFSAAAYYFGREVYTRLHIPIGLIHSSWGGTIAEAWTSAEGLHPLGDFAERLTQEREAKPGSKVDFSVQFQQWCEANDPGTKQGWAKAECDTASWKSVNMPQAFEKAGLPEFDGIVWFRRTFELPADWNGKQLTIGLGAVDDIDTTWINGTKVGQMNRYDLNRVYQVAPEVAHAGVNTVSVRVLDTGGDGGFIGRPDQMFIKPSGPGLTDAVSLAGAWQMQDSAPLSKLPAPPMAPDINNPNVVTVLYNGMIAPLLPFAIKGAIWYQGESNAGRAEQYRKLLPAMIRDWRKRFGVGDFPFYIVQLAAWQPVHDQPRDNDWAELREAQALTAKRVPHSGLAVAIDIGEANDIHPKNKAEVGRRLALCALAQTYGEKLEYSGPWYHAMKIRGAEIHLSFDHVDGGLSAKGGELQGFAIAGEERRFVWAKASIAGDHVVVSSPDVPKPVAVRYGWDINPVCNLYNQSGLPAVPFRTDDWPMITKGKK
ncbi:MAG TPA: sialate O-acetylesterase, partial [Verrucomicrobiae bacterium]|nr:sialate O-acetylesterase [Verrucomicrobiae bacterium]